MGPELVAVLSALAGVRTGDRVAVVGAADHLARALTAAAGGSPPGAADEVRVAVAVAARDLPAAAGLLAPGGRLVSCASDRDAASGLAAQAGLLLLHVLPAPGGGVAWSARRPER